jgi:hypothetical protein
MLIRPHLLIAAGGIACLLLNHKAMAQTPTATVHDYLTEVRIFAPGSPEFATIASKLGVDATLNTLGPGASLVAALRNDSGQTVELRILFNVTKGGKTSPHGFEVGRVLAAGAVDLVAPREIGGALAGLLNAGKPGLITGSPTVQPLDDYQGATVTVSIDSATLADGKFIGADTQNYFDRVVAEDNTKKQFFSDVVAWLAAKQSQAQIEQALTARKAKANAGQSTGEVNLAAITESGLAATALAVIQYQGMASLATWATKENAAVGAKPSIHK